MQITVQYEAQARRAAGTGSESIDVADECRVADCIRQVADAHGSRLKPVLINDDGDVQPTLLIFLNDSQIAHHDDIQLSNGDTLTLMPPISGG